MIAFARLKTRTLLFKLWPERINFNKQVNNQNNDLKSHKNREYLNAIKDGGVWFT